MAGHPRKHLTEDEHRALQLLAFNPDGATVAALVFSHGFKMQMLDDLVRARLCEALLRDGNSRWPNDRSLRRLYEDHGRRTERARGMTRNESRSPRCPGTTPRRNPFRTRRQLDPRPDK